MEAVDDHHARLEREQRLTKLKRADKALAERKKALREVKAALRDCPFAQGRDSLPGRSAIPVIRV